ncbi:MAG: AMP-binding protein [Burkholderiales bacterium]
MNSSEFPKWQPRPEDLTDSNIARLMQELGFADYDDLLRFSIEHPDQYWRVVNKFCGIVWSRDYDQYIDTSRGIEFPRWFVGGELNWVDTVLRWADHPDTANRPAIIAEREQIPAVTVTYAELRKRVRDFAAGLARQGIRRGDRVGLLSENGLEANVALLGVSYLGAIVVPLFSGFGVDAIVARLGSCEARTLIASTGFSRRGQFVDARAIVETARQQLPSLEFIIWKHSPEGPDLRAGDISYADVASANGDGLESARMSPDDPFMVIYTSGTTGKPKGPVHTHGGFPLKMAHDSQLHFDVRMGDVFCWPADMGWVAGPLVSTSALLNGATLVCYDGAPDYPDWTRMGRLIETHKVTVYGASPTLIRGYATHSEQALSRDMSSIRLLITAGEAIDPVHFKWFEEHFGRGTCPVINVTGGTEATCALLSSVVVKPIAAASFNTVSPSVATDVVDDQGDTLIGSIGELSIRAPFVGMTQSFWQDDERYLESYWRTNPGQWIHGDLALHDEEGFFYILGRSDDTIKVAGKRLGPAEVEEILLALDSVSEAAAIGVTDPAKGQRLIVFVIPTPEWKGTDDEIEREIKNHVADRMGKPFRPSRVYVMKELPKTRSLKVMRRLIRNVFTEQRLGDLSALGNPSAIDELKAVLEAEKGR